MTSSVLLENPFHVRSVSLPTRSHPIALKIDEHLNQLKTWEVATTSTLTANTIQNGLVGLVELYNCVDDFIHLPLVEQTLVQCQHEKLVEEALDESVGLLDICGTARDTLSMIKAGTQDLQSVVRRNSGGQSSMEKQISSYTGLRKKMKKDIKKCLAALKKMNDNKGSPLLDENNHLSILIRLLREVRVITISVFWCLLSFLSSPVTNKKPVGWSLVSKLMNNGLISCQKTQKDANEVESVDVALHALYSGADVERMQTIQKRLKSLEVGIEGLEDGLERIYRRLIQTRVSLLNVLLDITSTQFNTLSNQSLASKF